IRRHFAKVLTDLSRKSGQYPKSLTLQGVDNGEWVASGGFADVWKGHLEDGQVVSIKRPRIARSQAVGFLKLWSREIILWSQLSHPNVLPLYGIYYLEDVESSPVCMVSPWMENGNLVQFLRSTADKINRLLLTLDIASGLEYLHEQGIIHGDLKGLNILVTSAPVRACITDFGLSNIIASQIPELTSDNRSSTQGGTLAWQAPETMRHINPSKSTRESDMYSFACVCYELFTGKPPFCETETFRDVTIMLKVLNGDRPSRPASSELNDTVWNCMTDCWKAQPAERPTATDIV
ncbi:kinase-like domain-containing protein, partial [Mycena floridula]